jgi:two-component system response regulator MprA
VADVESTTAYTIREPSPNTTEGRTVADSRPTVLIVEDHAVTRAGLTTLLGEQGYDVATAAHGRAALDLLRGGLNPDVVLLDMLLPELDGWKFLPELRKTPQGSVPVIVMSGIGLSQEWAKAAGCADFLRKPFDERALFASLSRALKPA